MIPGQISPRFTTTVVILDYRENPRRMSHHIHDIRSRLLTVANGRAGLPIIASNFRMCATTFESPESPSTFRSQHSSVVNRHRRRAVLTIAVPPNLNFLPCESSCIKGCGRPEHHRCQRHHCPCCRTPARPYWYPTDGCDVHRRGSLGSVQISPPAPLSELCTYKLCASDVDLHQKA